MSEVAIKKLNIKLKQICEFKHFFLFGIKSIKLYHIAFRRFNKSIRLMNSTSLELAKLKVAFPHALAC